MINLREKKVFCIKFEILKGRKCFNTNKYQFKDEDLSIFLWIKNYMFILSNITSVSNICNSVNLKCPIAKNRKKCSKITL